VFEVEDQQVDCRGGLVTAVYDSRNRRTAMTTEHAHGHAERSHAKKNHYAALALMALLSYVAMYVLMYANAFDNVYMNINQVYMAGLMASPMVIIELAMMWGMYPNRKANLVILAASAAALVVFWLLIRQQTGVGDQQFLRSMIPHHAGAILMCEHAAIEDPEIKALCQKIRSSQQSEIDLMKRKLEELKAK
jgi:uncharacterized protein (DUF305 family)